MYQGKTMLITGCYQGIGEKIVKYFANLGVNIIMTYHNNYDKNMELARELEDNCSIKVDCYYLDLCKEGSIKEVYNYVKEKYEKIDYLVNNAALSLDNDIQDKSKDEFMQVLETNVVGTFLMMKYFDNIVDGYIFNISSTDGINTGNVYSIDYNASKAAINNMTKTFSLYSSNKIISICPNWVDTESTKKMDNDYLESELERIKQDKLISVETIPKVIDDCIKSDVLTGSIIRIEGDNDVQRID